MHPRNNWRHVRSNCLLFTIVVFIIECVYIGFDRPSATQPATHLTHTFPHPVRHPVDCPRLFEGDPDEVKHALALLSALVNNTVIPDEQYRISKEQCHLYRADRFNEPFHREDTTTNRQFPLAFSILMYDNVEQLERLLRVIYRPQNYYCIHVDSSASLHVQQAARSIVQCFTNVFLSSKQESVLYTTFSRLQADLYCMQDLIRYPSWKYLLNMANSELPLKSNSELVRILSIYRGHNDIEGRWKSRNTARTEYVWERTNASHDSHGTFLQRTSEKKKTPPGNVEIVKGSAYGAFSRAFVEFAQTSSVAKELLDWSRDTYSPDEHYWATLNYNTHLNAPGGHKAKSDPTVWTARFVNWGEQNCYGRVQRGICVFGSADLTALVDRHELVANKFQVATDPIAYQCQEEVILSRSRSDIPLHDATFYRRMPFLASHS